MKFESVCKKLAENGIEAFCVETKEEVPALFARIAPAGSSVGVGGSVSVSECGLLDYVKGGDYRFVGREVDSGTDFYLCSSNAVTENGELYNVDGTCNRIANIAYGPKNVVMVVGVNKLVRDLDEAVLRVKTVAAPKNCVRLAKNTPCAATGRCASLSKEKPSMADGCQSSDRICCNYLVSGKQRVAGRIKVIFVNEPLGY